MDSKYLKYGSLITLSTIEGYFLYSQGFIDCSPYLREQTQSFSEFSGSVFRIVPHCMYSVQNRILNDIKGLRRKDFSEKIPQIVKMEEKLEGEIKTNLHSYNTYKGQVIRYDSLIQLEHFTSHKFLTLKSQSQALTEKDSFKLSFEDHPSEYSHFRIMPSYKYQKHGSGKVKISDKVYLQILVPVLRRTAWMHGSKGLNLDLLDIGMSHSKKVMCQAIEVNVSLDFKTRWIISLYGGILKDDKCLACGDYIWMFSPEDNGIIVFNDRENRLTISKAQNVTNGLWVIEYEDPCKGGAIQEDLRYRLKHVVSGKYLAITDRVELTEETQEQSLWKFISFKSDDSVRSEELSYLIHDTTNLTIRSEKGQDIVTSHILNECCIYKPSKANPDVIWEILFLLHCYPILADFPKHFPTISEFSEHNKTFHEFRKYFDSLRTCIKDLKHFVKNRLQSMIGIDNHFGEVQRMRQIILKDHHFIDALTEILDCVIPDDEFENYKDLPKVKAKQYKINKRETDLAQIKLRTISEFVKLIYRLLINICDKNPNTQQHAYKFVNVFTKHVGLDLGATELILAILGNNEELMLKVHQNQEINLITFYSQRLLDFVNHRKKEFITFLKSICVFKGEAVSVNQEKVFHAVINNKEIVEKILIETIIKEEAEINERLDQRRESEKRRRNLAISLATISEVSFTLCFESAHIIGYESEIKYFISLLEFYSNLCCGRNFESAYFFMEKFPFDILNSLIWNNDLTVEARAAFCKLLLNIYIDCVLREEASKPELIKEIKNRDQDEMDRPELQRRKTISIFDAPGDNIFAECDEGIPELLENIFYYFKSEYKEDVLTFEILQIVYKLIRYDIISISDSENSIDSKSEDSQEQNINIVSMIKLILPLLYNIKQEENTQPRPLIQKKGTVITMQSSTETRESYMHYLSYILKDSYSLSDPVIRSATNLKNFLNLTKQNPFNQLEKKTIKHRIKLKICKILEYYFDSRQDSLLNNVIKWFDSLYLSNNWNNRDLIDLLPPVIVSGELSEIKNKMSKSNFIDISQSVLPDIQSVSNKDLVPKLFTDLTRCDNSKLQTNVLSLIFRCFNQRKEMLKNIKNVHVVFRSRDSYLIEWIKCNLLKFRHHSEQSEIWMNYWQNENEAQQVKHKEVFTNIIKILQNIEKFLYEDSIITENGPSEPEQKKISKSRQEILNYLNVHKVIITLIKDGLHKLGELYKTGEYAALKEPCSLLIELFESCFRVLKNFVLGNSRNQKKVHKYFYILTQYLYIPLGQIPLICEIFRKNWQLVSSLTEDTIEIIEDLLIEYGRQKEFLSILDVILDVNDKPNSEIQRLILSLFIKEKLNVYTLYMVSESNPVFSYKAKKPGNYFYKDEPIEYHAILLTVLSKCGKNTSRKLKNGVKCQNIINLVNLFEILNKSQDEFSKYSILKIPALQFFYNNYLNCESPNLELKTFSDFFEYIRTQSEYIEELLDVSEEYTKFIDTWIDILSKYRKVYINKIHNIYHKQPDITAIRNFIQVFIKNAEKFRNKINKKKKKKIKELCKIFEENFEIFKDNDYFIDKNEESDTSLSNNLEAPGMESKKSFNKWKELRELFISNKDLKDRIKEEELGLVYAIHFCDKVKGTTNFGDIVKILISYVRVSRSQKPPLNILIMVIQLLERIIANPISDNKIIENKTDMQYKMSFHGLSNVILTLVVDSQLEKSVFKALLSLSIQLLEGGNQQIQKEFYQYFLTYSNSEYFFYRINKIIQDKIEKIAETQVFKHKNCPVYKERKNLLKITLRFLQLLCENHNHFLQTYLRTQEKSSVNFNMITCIIDLLTILMKKKCKFHFHIISQCFETLTEFIQGPCIENQNEIIGSNFIEIASDLLSYNEYSMRIEPYHMTYSLDNSSDKIDKLHFEEYEELSGWMIAHLKLKCLITIISLFEGRKDSYVNTRLIRSLSLDILQENLKNVFANFLDYYKEPSFNNDMFNHIKDNEKYDFNVTNNPQDLRLSHSMYEKKYIFSGNPKYRDERYYCLVIENGFLIYHLIKILKDTDDPENIIALGNDLNSVLAAENLSHKPTTLLLKEKNISTDKKEIRETLKHYKLQGRDKPKDQEIMKNEALKFFEKHTGNIEVVFAGQIFRIYFYYPPEYKGLNDSIKGYFQRKAARESDQSKLKYLLDIAPEIIELVKHEFLLLNIMKRYKAIAIIIKNVEKFRVTAFVLTLLINVFILLSYEDSREYRSIMSLDPGDEGIGSERTEILFQLFGIAQIVVCIVVAFFFLLKNGLFLLRKGWENKTIKYLEINYSSNAIAKVVLRVTRIGFTIFYVLSNSDVIYYTLYAIFSILGLYSHPIFFSLLLLDIIYWSPSLQNVVNSIVLQRKALALTFLLTLVIVYISTILGYWLFYDDYLSPNCKSLLQCLFIIWDESFKHDGGIGGFLHVQITPNYDTTRFFYDNIYNIVVIIVLMGVVQGIIIDTFARLREEQEFCKADMESKCFICGLRRDFIEKHTKYGFSYHVKNEHRIWNYIMFILYLTNKDPTEYTGIESYVREQIDKDELMWIPNQSALAIKQTKTNYFEKELQTIGEEIERIEQQVTNLK